MERAVECGASFGNTPDGDHKHAGGREEPAGSKQVQSGQDYRAGSGKDESRDSLANHKKRFGHGKIQQDSEQKAGEQEVKAACGALIFHAVQAVTAAERE